jgi:hypothetical protein
MLGEFTRLVFLLSCCFGAEMSVSGTRDTRLSTMARFLIAFVSLVGIARPTGELCREGAHR